jgi:hypothetical protein
MNQANRRNHVRGVNIPVDTGEGSAFRRINDNTEYFRKIQPEKNEKR